MTRHLHENEAIPGVWGNRVKGAFISGEQGQILRGSGKQNQYWGTRNTFSIFGTGKQAGNKPIYFRGKTEQVASPPPPPLPPQTRGVWGNRVKGAFISGEQGQILRGSGKQNQYWGTRNTFSIFGTGKQAGNKPIYFRGKTEQVAPPPHPPPTRPWEGLENGSKL